MPIRAATGPVLLAQDFPVTHMAPSVGVPTPAGAAGWLLNLIPVNGYLRQRPPFQRQGTASGPSVSSVMAHGQLWKADGTIVTWALEFSGTMWSFNWSSVTWTSVVSAANFTTAGITVAGSGRAYWCVFNNTLVVNDGVNRPWTWDGTSGAGGLTSLTNAPSVCYGRPTVYYAKLFFIKNSDRRAIVWSEENLANTGYEAGGYSNVWVLGQTTSAPLVAIHGTNDGFYYFRSASIGVIRGAVSTDFATSGVHDSVSTEHGCASIEGVAQASQRDIWFVNQYGHPCVIPAGGSPVPVAGFTGKVSTVVNSLADDGFGYGDVSAGMTADDIAAIRMIVMRSSPAWPYPTVWMAVTTTDGAPGAALVIHAEAQRALCWVKPYGAASMQGLECVFDGNEWVPAYINGRCVFAAGVSGTQVGSDQNTSGSVVATTCRFLSAPIGGTAPLEFLFDVLHLTVGGNRDAQLSGTVQLLTSRKPHSTAASAALTWTTTTLDTDFDSQQHLRLGFNQSGRWARVMVVCSATQLQGFSIHDVRLEAIPQAVGLDVP